MTLRLKQWFRKMGGKPMTKKQLRFRDELRQKVRNKIISVAEAHRIWEEKNKVDSGNIADIEES